MSWSCSGNCCNIFRRKKRLGSPYVQNVWNIIWYQPWHRNWGYLTMRVRVCTLRVYTRAFGPRLEKSEKPLIIDFCGITFFTTHICTSYVVENIIFGISVPDYTSRTVEATFLGPFLNSFYLLVVNDNKYLSMFLTISYSESAYPITPV